MAKVSLRIYNREIERLIEQGNIDESIAHCRHILKTFPKHLETYRLLGKAYLEARRYSEAVDVFGRLLQAVPDDFVAHVGLSIIRDEENKMDDAIWHMERAFEVQPSNAAIQGELQRLYGRRDGVEPPKVRMTRGALARIYVQGELYPQAIAEIRSLLAEDPQRSDIQVLLAHSYFKSGQKSDASDLCNQLLKRYPYCFDANRIMVELLPATAGTAESTQVYRMRVGELDPYAIFTKTSIYQSNEVPDASVNLERLDYAGEEVPVGQEWGSTFGADSGASVIPALGAASTGDQPEWLKSGSYQDESSQASFEALDQGRSTSGTTSEDEIPDFLRAAGWSESKTPEQPTSMFEEETEGSDLVPADLPDWLKGQFPAEGQQTTEPRSAGSESIDTPDWLSALDNAAQPPETFETPQTKFVSTDTSDLMNKLGKESQPAESFEIPQTEASSTEDVPDWLQGLGSVESAESTGLDDEDAAQPADLPDWLKGAEPAGAIAAATASVESLGSSAQEQDDAVAWLESLAAKHGAKPEELVTDPNKRSETPPEWVKQAQNIGQQSAPETPSQADVQKLGASAQEQDDAVAWLESLAAKHGAKPEELVTDPNKRSETPPEWVQQAQEIGKAQPASAPTEEPVKSEPDWLEGASVSTFMTDETGMWLRNLDETEAKEEKEESFATPTGEAGDLPEWLRPTDEEQKLERGNIPEWLNDTSQPEAASTDRQETAVTPSDLPNWLSDVENESAEKEPSVSADQVMGNQDLSDWLSSLDNEPGLELDPDLLRASQRPPYTGQPEKSDEAQSVKNDLPNWLSETESDHEVEDEFWKQPVASPSTDEPAPVNLTADLPDWLQGVDEESTAGAESNEDMPPWLHREQWESEAVPEQPKPITPADWHPISEKAAEEKPSTSQPAARQRLVQDPPTPEPNETVAVEKKKVPAKQPRSRKAEGQGGVSLLTQARSELDRGDIPQALIHFEKLIKKGKHLEEIISSLNDSLYRYPVEVNIWQALGDAYMRANRLKEALDAYNKAEELIR